MESITIYPKNEKQKSLLKSLLEEMKIQFKIEESTKMSEEEFYAKIDKSIKQAEEGKTYKLTQKLKKELFKSALSNTKLS